MYVYVHMSVRTKNQTKRPHKNSCLFFILHPVEPHKRKIANHSVRMKKKKKKEIPSEYEESYLVFAFVSRSIAILTVARDQTWKTTIQLPLRGGSIIGQAGTESACGFLITKQPSREQRG